MQPILHGFSQKREVAALNSLQKQRNALYIEHRIVTKHARWQEFTCFACRKCKLRCQNNKAYGLRPRDPHRDYRAVRQLTADGQFSKQGRCDIVRMMFQCARGVEQSLQWKRTGNRFEEPQTPHRRSGATAEARFCGYSAFNLYMQRREGLATLTGKKAKRAL